MTPSDVTYDLLVVYISGPMTGLPEFNIPTFRAVAAELREAGYTVLSPHENGLPQESTWREHMGADIRMLTHAAGIVMLPGWPQSSGARIELEVALALKMPVFFYRDGEIVRMAL
jgi:hypothetical protein